MFLCALDCANTEDSQGRTMEITRNGLETDPGPSDWFTGSVYVDPIAAPSEASRVAIRLEGLTKRFDTVTVLDGIDLKIPTRTVFSLLGARGAGKTTRIRGLPSPDEPRRCLAPRPALRRVRESWRG
jgi:ATPase subunit of ABC transporter with duplicated ATPase domains